MCQIDPLHTNFERDNVNSVETVCKEHISDFLTQNSDFGRITDKIKSMVTVQEWPEIQIYFIFIFYVANLV